MRKWIVRLLVGLSVLVASLVALVAWFGRVDCFPTDPKRDAETGARLLRTAAQQWQASSNATSCPTIAQLVAEKQLDPGQSTNDSWDQPYRLTCTHDEITVRSSGRDKQFGTADDIVVPGGERRP
jgi:general secretion pathway protein G